MDQKKHRETLLHHLTLEQNVTTNHHVDAVHNDHDAIAINAIDKTEAIAVDLTIVAALAPTEQSLPKSPTAAAQLNQLAIKTLIVLIIIMTVSLPFLLAIRLKHHAVGIAVTERAVRDLPIRHQGVQ